MKAITRLFLYISNSQRPSCRCVITIVRRSPLLSRSATDVRRRPCLSLRGRSLSVSRHGVLRVYLSSL